MTQQKLITLPNDDVWSVAITGTGPTIVLLHGYPIDHRLWGNNVAVLARSHTVIATDFPGFGASPPPATDICSMSALADGVAFVLDTLGVQQQVTVCGLSMGGYVALEFWQRHRLRMNRMIFCDSRIISDTDDAKQNRLRVADSVHQNGVEPIITEMLPKMLAKDASFEIKTIVTEMMRTATPAGIAAVQRGMAERADFSDRVSQIKIPMLCVVGSEDSISSPDEMREIAARIARCEFIEIAGAAHLTPLEQPDAFNEAVLRFFSKQSSS